MYLSDSIVVHATCPPRASYFRFSMDSYELLDPLCLGSNGNTFIKCKRVIDGVILVAKVFPYIQDSAREILLKEVHILAQLQHKHIVTYFEHFFYENKLYIIMEKCAGDLAKKLATMQGQMEAVPEQEAKHWFLQMALAVQCCHRNKVIHRDLKLSNVLVAENSNILKLADFGISRYHFYEFLFCMFYRTLNQTNDLAMTAIGTPYYSAPEVIKSEPYSFSCDIWSLGCIFYEVLSFRKPFSGTGLAELMKNIIYSAPVELPESYSLELRQLVSSMLSKKASVRPSIDEIVSAFETRKAALPRSTSSMNMTGNGRRSSFVASVSPHGFHSLGLINIARPSTPSQSSSRQPSSRLSTSESACGSPSVISSRLPSSRLPASFVTASSFSSTSRRNSVSLFSSELSQLAIDIPATPTKTNRGFSLAPVSMPNSVGTVKALFSPNLVPCYTPGGLPKNGEDEKQDVSTPSTKSIKASGTPLASSILSPPPQGSPSTLSKSESAANYFNVFTSPNPSPPKHVTNGIYTVGWGKIVDNVEDIDASERNHNEFMKRVTPSTKS